MKIFLTSLVFCFGSLVSYAQQDRFIYLQTENKEPFIVKLNSKVFNSSPSGYLIIPKLDDGLYSLIIGFPQTTDEQEFNCSINKKDVGFIIKNRGENHWQLLNLQTNTVIVPGDVITRPVVIYEKETDPFSVMLANAVHDSTILRKDVVKEVLPEKQVDLMQKDTAAAVALSNDSITSNTAVADPAAKDVVKEVLTQASGEVKKNDTTQTMSAADVVSKTDNLVVDSTKNNVAGAADNNRISETLQKDSTVGLANNDVVILKPGTVNDVTKEAATGNSNEPVIKDTAQMINSTKEVATTHSKKKRTKKGDNVQDKDVTRETVAVKTTEAIPKDTTQTISSNSDITNNRLTKRKRSKANNIQQDSVVTQRDIAKDILPEKTNNEKETVHLPANETVFARSSIKRKSKKNSREGMVITYIDDNGETKDTITILIPVEKKTNAGAAEPVVTVVTGDKNRDNVKNNPKPEYTVTKEEKEIIKEAKKEPVFISTMINSDCKTLASEDDFLKIRKKMVAENSDADMIKAARKYFKTRCFTTEQIKNLSVLFLKDEGKYMFFDAAYPFVSDSERFHVLEKQLSDDSYINRFRALVHK